MPCVASTLKKYTERNSPPYPAADCPDSIKKGNDGLLYKSVPNVKGIYAWKKVATAATSSSPKAVAPASKTSSPKEKVAAPAEFLTQYKKELKELEKSMSDIQKQGHALYFKIKEHLKLNKDEEPREPNLVELNDVITHVEKGIEKLQALPKPFREKVTLRFSDEKTRLPKIRVYDSEKYREAQYDDFLEIKLLEKYNGKLIVGDCFYPSNSYRGNGVFLVGSKNGIPTIDDAFLDDSSGRISLPAWPIELGIRNGHSQDQLIHVYEKLPLNVIVLPAAEQMKRGLKMKAINRDFYVYDCDEKKVVRVVLDDDYNGVFNFELAGDISDTFLSKQKF